MGLHLRRPCVILGSIRCATACPLPAKGANEADNLCSGSGQAVCVGERGDEPTGPLLHARSHSVMIVVMAQTAGPILKLIWPPHWKHSQNIYVSAYVSIIPNWK